MSSSKTSRTRSPRGRAATATRDPFQVPEAEIGNLYEYPGPFPASWGRFRMFLWKWLTIGDPTRP